MQGLLKWSSITILLLTAAACVTSCTTITEEQRLEAEREEQASIISRELAKAEAQEEEDEKAAQQEDQTKPEEQEKKTATQRLVELTIKTDKEEYLVGEPIHVTISYRNLDDERIRMIADGETAENGFSGEMLIIHRRNFEDSYSFMPHNMNAQERLIHPREPWTRTVQDLETVLQSESVEAHRDPESSPRRLLTERDRALAVLDLPRFQKPDTYTLQMVYYPNRMKMSVTPDEVQALGLPLETDASKKKDDYIGPKIIDEKIESNVLNIKVRRPDIVNIKDQRAD